MTSIINHKAQLQNIERLIREQQQTIQQLPPGKIIARNRNGSYYYTQKVPLPKGGFKEHYFRKEELPAASAIARRMYLEKQLEDLLQQKILLQKLIKLEEHHSVADQFLENHPGISQLISPPDSGDLDLVRQWKEKPYQRNQKYPEGLIYPTVAPGLFVRSKAEADLLSRFEHYHVPYHYEEILVFNGMEFAMDFTLLNVRSMKIWYWDHRGMLDTESYIQKTLYCDSYYLRNGIIPWINLITTTETKEHPLDIQWVDHLIEYYLL
ncbi:MAG: hypothetical protein IJ106_13635 [Parasporobacterium sp.]|nr:hypothetical protein [Parasporobacterium sp.]